VPTFESLLQESLPWIDERFAKDGRPIDERPFAATQVIMRKYKLEAQAHFSDIRSEIIKRLSEAKNDVLVAVAWITDRNLYTALISCLQRGIGVSIALLDDQINRQSSIGWENLKALGGMLWWIPQGTDQEGSLHHKFCLIDDNIVISGSFNWTYRASRADENIVIIEGDRDFAFGFRQAFEQLLSKHGHDESVVPFHQENLMLRLALISNFLELEDFDELPAQSIKLHSAIGLPGIRLLVEQIESKDWVAANSQIKYLLARGHALVSYNDSQNVRLRWQVRLLGIQVQALEVELAEMERRIHLFDFTQHKAIGGLIRRYLNVKRQYLAKLASRACTGELRDEATAAEQVFCEYQEACDAHASEPVPIELDEIKQDEIRYLYRRLAMQCHPDRVGEESKPIAQALFQQLQCAYQNSDLVLMRTLKLRIETKLGSTEDVSMPEVFEILQKQVEQLQARLDQLTQRIVFVMNTITWKTLDSQPDWDQLFSRQTEQLEIEIAGYESALNSLQQES
jgi:hypothetical protein